MRELALHILDIAENGISAGADTMKIVVAELLQENILYIAIEDNGRGMSPELVARVTDPFVTSRTTRKVGMGIPLLKAAAEMCNGFLKITSELGKGTCVEIQFQYDHIDRMPLGNIADTLITLVVGSPNIHWLFDYKMNQETFNFDNQPIKDELGDIPLTEPDILAWIREYIHSGIKEVRSKNKPN